MLHSPDNSDSNDNQSIFDLASEEICFLAHSQNYCVCFVDMVNSTKITAEISDRQKVRQYYSIFINTMAVLAKNYNAKIVKNAGDALIFYFPETSDPANELVFNRAFECFTTMILAHGIINAKINSMAEPNGIVIGGDLYQIIKSFSFIDEYQFRELRGYSIGFDRRYPVYAALRKNTSEMDFNRINRLFIPSETPKIKDVRAKQQSHLLQRQQQKYSANIMVVDDEPDTLFTYKCLLSVEGYNVEAFTDHQEALKHFVQLPDPSSHHQLVLLDIRMPRLNGLQLFYRIKAISPNTKIMFCSALDIAEELVSILPDIKYDYIIKKPVKREYFVSKINSVLNNSAVHFESLSA